MKNRWKFLLYPMLLLLSSAVFAITPLPPEGASAQPQGGCSATASCGQVAPVKPAKSIGVILPSWCSNPDKTAVEQMICAVPDIAKLDNDLNRLYQVSPNPDMVASRRSERDACAAADCIRQWYQKWLAQMAMGEQPQLQSYQALIQRQQPTVTQYQPPQSYQPQPIQQFQPTQSAQAGQPSWCGAAATQVEQMICGNPELSALDNQLNNLFAQKSSAGKGIGKSRRNERDRATTAQAIAAWYRKWIAQLSQ